MTEEEAKDAMMAYKMQQQEIQSARMHEQAEQQRKASRDQRKSRVNQNRQPEPNRVD